MPPGPKRTFYSREFKDWAEFAEFLQTGYLSWPLNRRRTLYFRGQSNSDWSLVPVIDRGRRFADAKERTEYAEQLRAAFRAEIRRFYSARLDESVFDENEIEGLARHHGVPTTLLDWTQSPFVAAYFAFADLLNRPEDQWPSHVAVFRYNPRVIQSSKAEYIEILPSDGRGNSRAWAQRSIYMKVKSLHKSIEHDLGQPISKYTLPSSEASRVLTHLDEMGINGGSLFPDHEGAGRVVLQRYYRWSKP